MPPPTPPGKSEAFRFCQQRIQERKMEMKLVRAEYLFDGSKIIFYFTADGRVDFRELVKDLAHHFHTRIEMRQIGVRDEAKFTGGIGICGRELCCCTFLTEFAPVSVKMAKEQGLALNPNKISGQCGRLLCCLAYEFETYCAMKKCLPKCGRKVQVEGRELEVVDQNVLAQKVTRPHRGRQNHGIEHRGTGTSAHRRQPSLHRRPLPASEAPEGKRAEGTAAAAAQTRATHRSDARSRPGGGFRMLSPPSARKGSESATAAGPGENKPRRRRWTSASTSPRPSTTSMTFRTSATPTRPWPAMPWPATKGRAVRRVFFLTGTDEHGQKVEKAAQAKGETPLELADRVVKRFQALWEKLDISHTRLHPHLPGAA